jgi:thioredoxin reductase (NADPH)
MQTSVAGVFAAGEVADATYKQVVTSAGMGAAAAIQALHFLEG